MVLRRLAEWLVVLALVAGSYAWWGTPETPLRHLLPVAAWSAGAWLALLALERFLRRRTPNLQPAAAR
jgi:hypothetical protein